MWRMERIPTTGSLNSVDSFGTTLTGSHPFSLVTPLKDAPNLVASLVSKGMTADPTGAVKLVNGSIECTSCHSPARASHRQDRAEFSGPRQLKRADVPGLS